MDYEANLDANLDPPNVPDKVADDQDAEKEDQDDDSNDSGSDDDTGVDNWHKDEEKLELQNESDPKIHQEDVKYGDGTEVRDLEILHSNEDKSEDSEEEDDQDVDEKDDQKTKERVKITGVMMGPESLQGQGQLL